ncbi:MAG: hypothetical protein HeimC3_43980 [Candidatus Heimdallarchaeota archaeon LC_3]|nr:MAG: hypothetical protein HeimC3_43980 [Candidatus Heimdallarchaeota archaeon LC_3]
MSNQPSRNGTSIENAIIIDNTENHFEGVNAEYRHLTAMYGERGVGWILEKQSLIQENGRYYDFIEIKLSHGSVVSLYFDITSFFGKGF